MRLTVKQFTEILKDDGSLDKQAIMRNSVADFKSGSFKGTLADLGEVLKDNIVYSNIKWRDDYRLQANADLSNIDIILLDIDNGLSIDEVLKLPFSLMCLTTTSHTVEKPKFRVFLPLLDPISLVNNDEFKELLSLISSTYFSGAVDVATMESGRAYITTNRALSFVNEVSELLNLTALLETVKRNIVLKEFARLVSTEKGVTLNTKPVSINVVRSYPKVKALIAELGAGSNYGPVYRIMGICRKAGLGCDDTASLILSLNIGNEYSDRSSLLKKIERYK